MHLSHNLAGGVRLFACLQFMCLPLWQLICFPVWLVVSGSSPISNSFVSRPCGNSLVSQSGWWCPALLLSPILCLPLWQLICLPVWLVVSGSLVVSKSFVSPCGNSFVFDCGAVSSNSSCLPLVSEGWVPNCLPIAFQDSDLSPRIGLPIASKCFLFVALFFPSRLSRCCVPLVT